MMMNIPREGNADALNKSTKLTLSSKKTYDTHLQNINLMNNPAMMHMVQNSSQSAQANPQTSMAAVANLNSAAAMGATRTKMNSTMMVKFNSSTEKNIG